MASFPKYSTFFNSQKNQTSKNLNKSANVKMRGNFQYVASLSVPRFAKMFYIIYIKKIFDWSKIIKNNKVIEIIFLQVGKLRLH